MGPRWRGLAATACLAVLLAGCGGSTPTSPATGTGGGAGGSGGSGGGGTISTVNAPPAVKSISVSDPRIEIGTPVTFTANVEDAETPIADLQFAWTFPPGGSTTAAGNGSSITWTPGAGLVTPLDSRVTVKVTERYTSGGTQQENTATGSVDIHVNNSSKELADLSLRFLGNFADSKVSPDTCVAEFSTSCNGKKDEFSDITGNRHDFLILSSTLRNTGVDPPASNGKRTVHTFCAFTSRVITKEPVTCSVADCPYDSVQSVQGDCYTTNVYEQGRWWLCESHFSGARTLTAFERAFFGIRKIELP